MANASSGAAVNDECQIKFKELKAKRTYRFITYMLKDQKEVVVEHVGAPEASYDDFTKTLPENDCRYAVFDYDFMSADDVPKSRIFYILWSPDTAKVRSKMLYASSSEKFKRMLDGIQVEMHATDASEITIDEIKARAK